MRGRMDGKTVRRFRKGSATLEFITILPLVFMMCLFVWQFVVAGMAVMETQTLVKEGARLAAQSGDADREEKRGLEAFPATRDYRLISYRVQIRDGQATASAETEIDAVFLPLPSFKYTTSAKAPVIQ